MSRLLVLSTSLMLACTGLNHDENRPSLSLETRLMVRLQQTLNPDESASAFAPTARPENFPLSEKRAIRIVRLRRLQTIDRRIIAEYFVLDGTEQKSFTVWFEQHDGQWLIAGWTNIITRPARLTTVRTWLDLVPRPLAANALRGRALEMTVEIPATPTTRSSGRGVQNEVALGLNLRANGPCRPAQMKRSFRAMEGKFKQCYGSRRGTQRTQQGRLTIDIVSQDARREAQVSLRESTLIDTALTECALQVTRTAIATPIPNCIATLRLTFKPN